MDDNVFIVYGFKRSDRFLRRFCKDHEIEIGKTQGGIPLVFIDVDGTDREELRAVLAACRPGVVVVVAQLSDFGTGAKSKEIQKRIEAAGASVMVPEKILQKRGPKPKGILSEEDQAWAQSLYDNPALSRKHVADAIERRTGVKFTRHKLRARFAGKRDG